MRTADDAERETAQTSFSVSQSRRRKGGGELDFLIQRQNKK
jgi:hypothetical protein